VNTNALVLAAALPDRELLARLETLAASERGSGAELIAHLAVLDARRSLYSAAGYGSLFAYCREALRLSEDAACARIDGARICRKFPTVLDLLASGELSLTTARLVGPHLTPENHKEVLRRACGRSRRDVEVLVAELAPRPDVPSTVRKVPARAPISTAPAPVVATSFEAATTPPRTATETVPPPPRPVVQPTAPGRYRVQFTIGQETHDKLRRLQTLLGPEVPNGDPAVIFDRAVTLLLERVEKAKCGSAAIRPGTDRSNAPDDRNTRTIPRWVRREVQRRDGGRCAFVSRDGRRCTERHFLQYHHIIPWALGGRATVDNIALRCPRHNRYEAEVVFGPRVRTDQGRRSPARVLGVDGRERRTQRGDANG
jgi:hypothetical protein